MAKRLLFASALPLAACATVTIPAYAMGVTMTGTNGANGGVLSDGNGAPGGDGERRPLS